MAEREKLKLLIEIAPNLNPKVEHRLLHRHATKGTNNFPEVKKTVGIHKFYDEDEVAEWWSFWTQITKGHRAGAEKRKNGSR